MGDYQQQRRRNEPSGITSNERVGGDTPVAEPGNEECCGYPKQVYFILGNEFCERFSYYGMHAILVIYLMSMLKMTKDDATAVYHAFNMLSYFSPIFGAIIADSCWGRYKTILYVSLLYALGNAVVSLTAIPELLNTFQIYGPALGLIFIALGTGGIKPCVSAFGGDQFDPGQEDKLQSFFSIFYFAINFGSLIATLLTPVLRADVNCFGYDCYPLAFGVPAILMILSLVLFVAGSRLYRKVPPEGNVVVRVCSAVWSSIKNRLKACGSNERREHWIDWASDRYSNVLKSDIKDLFKVLLMFLPLPVFWTLFDQQGSRWTLQAMEMNGDIGWLGTIKPDQMQALNPILVMLLIPFAETILYPFARVCGLLTRPLQRMGTGMLLVALSFVIAGYLQLKMEAKSSVANMPPTGFANYRIINTVPCDISVFSEDFRTKNLSIPYQHGTEYFAVPITLRHIHINSECAPRMFVDQSMSIAPYNSYTLIVGVNHSRIVVRQLLDDVTPLGHTRSKVRFLHTGGSVADAIAIKLNKTLYINLTPFANPDYVNIVSKSYHVRAAAYGTSDALALKRIRFGKGGIYTVVIQPNRRLDGLQFFVYEDVSPRPISILWQIPQYIVITLGEVMFSITGLEFAYSQSPPSMKSCIMAAWLLTVSIGNLLVVILAGARLTDNMAREFFFFAGLLGIVTIIFAIMAAFYRYVNYGYSRIPDDDDDDEIAMEPDDFDEPPDPPRGGPMPVEEKYIERREEKMVLALPRSPAREEPVKREFVRYQHKEQATEFPDMMEIPVRRIVNRKETDEFAMAAEEEGSTDSMVMAIEDEEETVLAIKEEETIALADEQSSDEFALAVEDDEEQKKKKKTTTQVMAVEEEEFALAAEDEDEEFALAVEDEEFALAAEDEEFALAAEDEEFALATEDEEEQRKSQRGDRQMGKEDVEWYGSREITLNTQRFNVDVDFPVWDFGAWKQSGHPITFGEIIGGMRFMVNEEISSEIASGMIAQTMVNHWMLRNVNTESGEIVQRKLYNDYQDFLSVSTHIRRGNFSKTVMERYQTLLQRRRNVYDIFVSSDTQTLTRKVPEERYLIQYNVNGDFTMYDFNLWKQSGHLMTFGEAIGSLQFMTERKISPEVASGIMARTLVEYWNERNVNTQSEETVQRRLYKDYQNFLSVTHQLRGGSVPESTVREYETLLGRRNDVYDIFVNNDPTYLRRKSQGSLQAPTTIVGMSPDGRMRTPDQGMRSPDKDGRGLEPRMQSPGTRLRSPDGRMRSPDRGRRVSPDKRSKTPDARMISTEDRIRSPDRIRPSHSPTGRMTSPGGTIRMHMEGGIVSSDGRLRSPDRGRRLSPDKRSKTPDARMMGSTGRVRSPDRMHSHRSPDGRLRNLDDGRLRSPDRGMRSKTPDGRGMSPGRRLSPNKLKMQSPEIRPRSGSGGGFKPHIDFPPMDFNTWQSSGHLVTFGEVIGAMQFMVNRGTTAEVASGMVSHTLVNHWMQRNVYPKSEKTVQKRIYKDFQDFSYVVEEINKGYLSETLRRKYQATMLRRDHVYDIFVGSDAEALKRTKMLEETFGVNMEAQHYRYLENQLSDIPRGHPHKLVSTPRNDRDYSLRPDQLDTRGYHVVP